MSRLEEFEKKLYRRGEEQTKKPKGYEVYKEDNPKIAKEGWDEGVLRASTSRGIRRSIVIPLFLLLISGVVVGGYYWYAAQQPFSMKNVTGEITGPGSVTAGDEITFSVTYRNNTKVALGNAQITFGWPEGAISSESATGTAFDAGMKVNTDIGTILAGQEKTATFKGRVYGSKDDVKTVQTVFSYIPEGFSSPFEDKKSFTFSIASTPFALNVNVPAQGVSDKEIDITLEYVNQSSADFDNIVIRGIYPSGFQLVSANPVPDQGGNNMWTLNSVKGMESGKIELKGTLSGVQGESKSLFFEIGSMVQEGQFVQYASASGSVSIASSALFVFQTVNDSRDFVANPGVSLHYKIRYKNTTNVQIPNVVIIAQIDDAYVDIHSLNVQWGSFDGRTNSIIWNSVGVPDLALLNPQTEGEVSFSVNVKPLFVPKSFSDKNLTVMSTAHITSSVPPESLSGLPIESADALAVKINTQFSFDEKAYFANGPIQNTGPIPPRVGQRTTYAISWQLSNTINDVNDVEVSAVIPPNVEWTGAVYPQGAPVSYDPNSGKITWKPGTVFAGTGLLVPATRVDFQLAFTPALVHVGQTVNLISGASLAGTDAFTGTPIGRQVSQVNSDLLNSLQQDQGRVLQ